MWLPTLVFPHDLVLKTDQPGLFPRAGAAVASHGDSVWVFGGSPDGRHNFNCELWRLSLSDHVVLSDPAKRSLKRVEAELLGPSDPAIPLAVGTMGVLLCIVSCSSTVDDSNRLLDTIVNADQQQLWPGPRIGGALVATDEYLYLYGGVADFPGWGPHFDSVYLTDLWRYHIARGQWELLGPLPSLNYLQTHCFIEEHQVVEGCFWLNRPSFFITFTPSVVVTMDTAFSFLEEKDSWPYPRAGHVFTKVKADQLLLYGGIRKSGELEGALRDGSIFFDDVYAYNTHSNTWLRLSKENSDGPALSLASGHVLNTRLYICGGCGINDKCHSLSVFDLTTNMWVSDIERYAALERIKHGCTLFGTHLIVYGGTSGKTDYQYYDSDDIEDTANCPIVCLELETWRVSYCYPFDRNTEFENHSLVSVVANGSDQPYLLLFGGNAVTLKNGLPHDPMLLGSLVTNKSFSPLSEYLNVDSGALVIKKPATFARLPLEGSLNDMVTYVLHGVWLFQPRFEMKSKLPLEDAAWMTPLIRNWLP